MRLWKPEEIIVHDKVRNDPLTQNILDQYPEVPVKLVNNCKPRTVKESSSILSEPYLSGGDLYDAGKGVLFISPGDNAIDAFDIEDNRVKCPGFNRIKILQNGCHYKCYWCYLKGTYRALRPYITLKTPYHKIQQQIERKLKESPDSILFDSGAMADSLALEHIIGAAKYFTKYIGTTSNGYLLLLTKSDNVDSILNIKHNGHTIVGFSLNPEKVIKEFEKGTPSLDRRLIAANKVQEAGYPLRLRLGPIVPLRAGNKPMRRLLKKYLRELIPNGLPLAPLY